VKKILEDLFHAGIGLGTITKEKAEKIFNELKKKGEVTDKEKDLFISKLVEKLEETGHTVGEKIKKTLTPAGERIDELNAKIDTLIEEIEKLKGKQQHK
jgi:polyhydroxyalkanoate synthesis regulator phasin